jgi:hypothetical protein
MVPLISMHDDHPNHAGLRRWRWAWFGTVGLVFLLAAAGLFSSFSEHRKSGHHSLTALVIGLIVLFAVIGVSGFVGWRVVSSALHEMGSDWRTRRRVGTALRRGSPISEADRPTARAIINYTKKRAWFPWLYVGLGGLWLLSTALAHGDRRWFDLVLGIFYLSLSPLWFHGRRKIISREREIAQV